MGHKEEKRRSRKLYGKYGTVGSREEDGDIKMSVEKCRKCRNLR